MLVKTIKEILNISLKEAKDIVDAVSDKGQCFVNICEKNVCEFQKYIEKDFNDVLILERITNNCSKPCEEIQQVSSQEIVKDKDDEIQNAVDDYMNVKAKCKALAHQLSEIQAKLSEIKEKYESALIEYNSLEIVKLFKNDGISNLP